MLNAGAAPGDQCVPTGGAPLSQKPGSWLVSATAVVGASPASAAALSMSNWQLRPAPHGHQSDTPQGLPDCESVQARLRDPLSAQILCTGPLVYYIV